MHKFIYENEYTEQEPRKITIEVGMDADLTEMLESFESYLRAVGYNFDGEVDILPEHSFDDTVRNVGHQYTVADAWTQDMTGTGQYINTSNYGDVKVTYGKNE